jgi:hypothetical protein
MTSGHILRRAAAPLAIATLLAACSGGGGGGTTTFGSPAPTDPSTSSTIELSGGATGTISQPGGCGKAVSDEGSWEVTFQTDKPGWMLDATIEGTKQPGTYQVGFHTDGAVTVLLYEGGGGTSFDSSAGSGSITVDGGSESGSLDVTVTDPTTGTTARAVGGWTCENWD